MTRYTYVGDRELTFVAYVDEDTDHTLTAVPGESYAMRGSSVDLPVPPDKISWVQAEPQQKKIKRAGATSAAGGEAEER